MFARVSPGAPRGRGVRRRKGKSRMVLFNYSTRELTAKVVYYGPGLCGKTTNLQYVHENLPDAVKGKMLSLATKTDRTLFFDFLPIDLGNIRGMKTRIQLYTVPGQVFYNETRKLVLKGADGVVFVADSQEQMLGANTEAFRNLEENLKANGISLSEVPHVLQFNKRDLPRAASIEELNTALNRYNAPFYESVATTGIGVQDTLRAIVKLVLLHLTRKYDPKAFPVQPEAVAPSVPAAAPRAPEAGAGLGAVPTATFTPREAAGAGRAAAIPLSAVRQETPAPRPSRAPEPPRFFAREEEEEQEKEEAYEETLAAFGDAEISELIEEVEEARPEEETVYAGVGGGPAAALESTAHAPPVEEAPSFEIDRSFDPDWLQETGPGFGDAESAPAVTAPMGLEVEPHLPAGPEEAEDDRTVLLTKVAEDADLFQDPALEIARLSPGETREIQVPVELVEGKATRRLRLSIRLRLDPAD